MSNKQTFSIKEQPCVKVVVFTDRAQVQRLVKTQLAKGENEIVINSISGQIDRDSVRVEGRGKASVLDVVCQDKTVDSQNLDNISEKEKELNLEISELESKIESLKHKLERINKQISVFNEFANNLSKAPAVGNSKKEDSSTVKLSIEDNVDQFLNFLNTYSTKLESLDDEKIKLEKELKILNEKLNAARDNLFRLSNSRYFNQVEITILVETDHDKEDVDLLISYVVYGASWVPQYDVRVSGNEKTMTVNYFGTITQSTGEDWTDTRLSLSTAMPSLGGNVPELETQNVAIRQPPPPPPPPAPMYRRAPPRMMMMKDNAAGRNEMYTEDFDAAPVAMAMMAPNLCVATMNVGSSDVGSTTTFEIPRNTTIPADNNSHKVTIGVINLSPEFEYESVPRKNTFAYLKAKVVNTSEYPFLAGSANIFFDNNFVAKTYFKAYSPQEEFSCSLGVDPSIKIDFKPQKKFKAQSGLISKTTTTTFVQTIEVKNTSSNSIKLLLSDHLPLSNDDKINVKLLEPNLNKSSNVRINKSNNLEFDLNLAAGKTEDINIKYTIDHPADKEIDFF